jgi:glucosamine--fructose-6-phosphate aminotransferase (isomerizing)
MAEKGGYKHFMLKEIFEQPRAVRDTTWAAWARKSGRIFLDEMEISDKRLQGVSARYASWPAAPVGMPRWPASS